MPPQNDGLGVHFGKRHDHPQVLDGVGTHKGTGEDQRMDSTGTKTRNLPAYIEGGTMSVSRLSDPQLTDSI